MTTKPTNPAPARSSAVPSSTHVRRTGVVAIVAILLCGSVLLLYAQTAPKPPAPQTGAAAPTAAKPPAGAKGFATAQAAADALVEAASTFDEAALVAIFGPEGKDLVSTEDPVRDKSYALAFAALARESKKAVVSPSNPGRATLEVGNESWPLPLPLGTDRWQVVLRREGRPRRDSVPARRRQRTRRDRSLPRVRRSAERVRP